MHALLWRPSIMIGLIHKINAIERAISPRELDSMHRFPGYFWPLAQQRRRNIGLHKGQIGRSFPLISRQEPVYSNHRAIKRIIYHQGIYDVSPARKGLRQALVAGDDVSCPTMLHDTKRWRSCFASPLLSVSFANRQPAKKDRSWVSALTGSTTGLEARAFSEVSQPGLPAMDDSQRIDDE